MTEHIDNVLTRTNWWLLAKQKEALIRAARIFDDNDPALDRLGGLLNWIDAIQDAAAASGYPVVYLEEKE